jgi:hypothetical protein
MIKWLEKVRNLLNWIKIFGWVMKLKGGHEESKGNVWWICIILENCVEIMITKRVGGGLDD